MNSNFEVRYFMKLMKLISTTAAALLLGAGLFGCSNASGKDLKVLSQKTVELGDPVSLNASDYLLEEPDSAVLAEIDVESPLKTDSKYSYNDASKTVTTAGRNFLQAGTYPLTLTYKGQEYPVTLTVKDTTMPVFVSPAAVLTIPVGEGNFNFSRVYRTQDKDSVSLKIEGDYDLNTVGTYPVTLIASDPSGNTNSLEITINVVGKNQQIKATDQFDDELVPSEEDTYASEDDSQQASSQAAASEEQTAPAPAETTPQPEPTAPADSTPPASDEPAPTPGTPSACPISSLPAGTEAYYSFSELYAAGTAWNKQNPNNYFYYLEGVDDCGNKIYALTRGTQTPASSDTPDVPQPADQTQSTAPAAEDKGAASLEQAEQN